MHPLSFLQKRTHLCAVARGLKMFEHVEDMTPARFDFLFVLYKYERSLVGIRRRLGLARQTVWEALERLIELGLVTKTKVRRRVLVAFTEDGRRRMAQALDAAFNDTPPPPPPAPPPPAPEPEPDLLAFPDIYGTQRDAAMLDELERRERAEREARRRRRTGHGLFSMLRAFAREQEEQEAARAREGRAVGRTYSRLAWEQTRKGRGKRSRYLGVMERLISAHERMAEVLGNFTPCLYEIDYREPGPEILEGRCVSQRELGRLQRLDRIERVQRRAQAREIRSYLAPLRLQG